MLVRRQLSCTGRMVSEHGQMPSTWSPASITAPLAMRSPIELRMTVICSTGRPNMVSSGPWQLSHRPTVYAQGGAISSPRTAETDQPTVRMSSATACMHASGSRPAPPESASHSAHPHRSSGGSARRLRGGFMDDTLRGGYDIFGSAVPGRTGPRNSGRARAERGGLDPVLARGRAVPAGAVARGIDVDPVAPGRGADAEPVVQLAAEHYCEAGAAARGPAVRQRAVGGVEVQVPGLPVVPLEFRPGSGADEQRVDLAGGVVHGAGADGLEHAAQFGRHQAQLGGLLPGRLARAGPAQDGADGRGALVVLGRDVPAPPVLPGREQVHQLGGDPDHDVHVTVEIHLTSYISPPSVVTVKVILASN